MSKFKVSITGKVNRIYSGNNQHITINENEAQANEDTTLGLPEDVTLVQSSTTTVRGSGITIVRYGGQTKRCGR